MTSSHTSESFAPEPISSCRGCGGGDLKPVLDLGDQPVCDHFPALADAGPDPRWPLALTLCGDCALLQLDHSSPAPEEPLAVTSATVQRHASRVVARLLDRLPLPAQGLGVREFSSAHGGAWREDLLAAGCLEVPDEADLVIDNHSIIHSEDLLTELRRRAAAVGADGYLAIEFHHALAQLRQTQFDTVRHGHPVYFSLHSWQAACRRVGFSVVDVWEEDIYGGCLVVVARRGEHPASAEVQAVLAEERAAGATSPAGYAGFAERTATILADLRGYLQAASEQGCTVTAYGAGSKSCTLLGVLGATRTDLPMIADLAPGKQGRRIPGTDIPIVSPQDLVQAAPDDVLILTWDIAEEVIGQLRGLGLTEARFTVPMPSLRTL